MDREVLGKVTLVTENARTTCPADRAFWTVQLPRREYGPVETYFVPTVGRAGGLDSCHKPRIRTTASRIARETFALAPIVGSRGCVLFVVMGVTRSFFTK